MQKLLSLLVAFVCGVASLQSAEEKESREMTPLQNVYARQHTSLNGPWHYIVDQQEIGDHDYRFNKVDFGFMQDRKAKDKSELVEYDFDLSPTMDIPTDWNTADDQLFFYEGVVWLRRTFDYQPSAQKKASIYFGAVNYRAVVYLNGQLLGEHEGGFTPFQFDVDGLIREGSNSLVVKVDNRRSLSAIPTNIFDWWNYGGITRDVLLVETAATTIEDYSLSLAGNDTQQLSFSVRLNKAETGRDVALSIPELNVKKTVKTDSEGKAELTLKARPQLWSPENPKLYDVQITLGEETITDEIAFRTIETSGKKILLNGKQIFLRGISIHEEKVGPKGGRANSAEDAHTLLSWAKELGCNYVRLAHYPHNELAVREAEKMGIMVWSEIPVYWSIDWTNADTYNNAQRQLRDMIARDHNRGAIIIWSIANETPHSPERDTFLSNLSKYARTQDASRLISMAMEVTSASNYVNTLHDNMNEYVDVISFNEYVGWYRDVYDAPKMSWNIPYDKPVIISEMGGGAIYGRHGDKDERWTEEFQAELYRQNFDMLDKIDGLAGTSPWILKDFLSPRRPLYGTQNWFNRKGLFSNEGQKKQAFWVVKEWYAKKAELYE